MPQLPYTRRDFSAAGAQSCSRRYGDSKKKHLFKKIANNSLPVFFSETIDENGFLPLRNSMSPLNQVNLDAILPLVRKPGQYVGGELHAVSGQMESDSLSFCLIFPDLYEIGMSHQGLQILYHILNRHPRTVAHRAYAPDTDMEQLLRQQGQPLFSLEGKIGLSAYDVLGITLPYELCYTNILTILDLAGIPLRSSGRDDRHPLILGGGSCALNPEPIADFFDAIVLGDGEEIILEVGEMLLKAKDQSLPRAHVLAQLATIPGVYVPGFFHPRHEQDCLVAITPTLPEYAYVRKRVLPELTETAHLQKPLVPVVKPVHDRLGIEIARGCTRGCRFCQAGITYRPVRERKLAEIMELATQGIGSSGFDELALLSLSTGDFSCLSPLMRQLMDHFAREHVSISMPSMRVGTLTPDLMQEIKRVRKTGFTVAPEAGTDRLREVINKGICEQDLLATCTDAFALGWKLIKLYFMVGLPTETDADVAGIVELARKARQQSKGRNVQINLGVATFVPKPHTPFQWEAQISLEQSKARINRLKQLLPRQGFKLKWHDPEQSYLEGVFSRGDRRLSSLIETAWINGARLDSWSEHFCLEDWRQAAKQCHIDLNGYLRQRTIDEIMPWDHLHSGVSKDFLQEEYAKALTRTYTPDCRVHGCQGCGLCDFKRIQPVVHPPTEERGPTPIPPKTQASPPMIFSYRVRYSRIGGSKYFGHLEMLQLIFRTLSRAGLPVVFSQGFNPTPRVSFSQALPVGVESLDEYFDVDLEQPLRDLTETRDALNTNLPEGLRVHSVALAPKMVPMSWISHYEVHSSRLRQPGVAERISDFLHESAWIIDRFRKNRHKELDIRPLVAQMSLQEEVLTLTLLSHQGQPGISPREVLEKVLGFTGPEALLSGIIKVKVEETAAPA